MTIDFEEPGRNEFLKNFNLFHLSYALTTIFIIKVSFPANTDILTYENDNTFQLDKWTEDRVEKCHLPSGPWARWQIFPENDKIFLFEN